MADLPTKYFFRCNKPPHKSINFIRNILGYPRRIDHCKKLPFMSRHFVEIISDKQIQQIVNVIATPPADGQIRCFHMLEEKIAATSTDEML